MAGVLDDKRVLIVEDEYFIAADLRRLLLQQGARPVGPVGDLRKGIRLAADEPLDAALLDVNLGEACSFPIMDRLAERGVPFMLLTGYDSWSLPDCYRGAPRLEKPFADADLLQRLERLMYQGAVR